MTEVVTTYAASPQLNLLAQRQQGFGVSTPITQPDAPTADSNALQSVLAASDKSEDKSFASELPSREANTNGGSNGSGPSRPRVEIKQFDVGLSPSEVVGTQDVLQRFDANGDGRVDLLESDKAALVRQKVFTFAGLAAAPPGATIEQTNANLSEADAPALARETGAAIAALSTAESEPGVPKKFSASIVQDPTAKKYFADAAEAHGAPTNDVDAPKKYYGQGAEVVIAGQATNGANPPVKYADRAPVKEQNVSEEGTGEVKYYDRVAQSEPGDSDGDPAAREKYSDKAQEIAAAYAALQGDVPVDAPAVTVVTA